METVKNEYNMRFILILDPAVSADESCSDTNADQCDSSQGWKDYEGKVYPAYNRGLSADAYIKGEDGEIEFGKVWPYLPGVYLGDIVQDDNGVGHCEAEPII